MEESSLHICGNILGLAGCANHQHGVAVGRKGTVHGLSSLSLLLPWQKQAITLNTHSKCAGSYLSAGSVSRSSCLRVAMTLASSPSPSRSLPSTSMSFSRSTQGWYCWAWLKAICTFSSVAALVSLHKLTQSTCQTQNTRQLQHAWLGGHRTTFHKALHGQFMAQRRSNLVFPNIS